MYGVGATAYLNEKALKNQAEAVAESQKIIDKYLKIQTDAQIQADQIAKKAGLIVDPEAQKKIAEQNKKKEDEEKRHLSTISKIRDEYKEALSDFNKSIKQEEVLSEVGDTSKNEALNNKIRIFMNHNVGSHISIPKYLNNKENSYFKKIHALQRSLKYRQLIDDKVLFREDDVGNKYEIYKIEHYPESYSDFDGNLIQIPDSEFIAPSYTYFDLIEPNKKYYYMFRTKDVHNQLSDMSYIYEVELFNDEGVIIPNIKIVEPRIEQPNKIPFKKFKKRVKIRPNLGQLLYSKNADGAEKFGASEFGSILNKNLCLRVTSKQTGRIVEYKFKFVTTKQEPENTQQEQINNC
jgi:hypothetical protein